MTSELAQVIKVLKDQKTQQLPFMHLQASEENKQMQVTDLSEIETLRGNFKCSLGRKGSDSSVDKNTNMALLREINNNRSNMTEAPQDV